MSAEKVRLIYEPIDKEIDELIQKIDELDKKLISEIGISECYSEDRLRPKDEVDMRMRLHELQDKRLYIKMPPNITIEDMRAYKQYLRKRYLN